MLDDLVGELQTKRTIEQHDAHAPEHGEPSELNNNNSTTCHKSASHTLTRRDHQYYIDGFLSYSTAYSSNATEWRDNYVGVKLECKRLLFVEYISLTLVHVNKSSSCGSLEWNSNIRTRPTPNNDNNHPDSTICCGSTLMNNSDGASDICLRWYTIHSFIWNITITPGRDDNNATILRAIDDIDMTASDWISAHALSRDNPLTSAGLHQNDIHPSTGSTYHNDISDTRHIVVFVAKQVIDYVGYDTMFIGHGFSSNGYILQDFGHTNNRIVRISMNAIMNTNAVSTVSVADGIIFSSGKIVDSTTQLLDTTTTKRLMTCGMIIATTANRWNYDSLCIPFNGHTPSIDLDCVTASNYVSGINPHYNNDTGNTHDDGEQELLPYIVMTSDPGKISKNYSCAFESVSNDWMNDVVIRTHDALSSNVAMVKNQYDTIMQSWKLDNELGFTLDNSMHVNEMKPCYLFQLTILYMHVVQTDGEYVMKRGKLTLDLCLGTRILISWMTKANRRGVTCTGEYGFVWYLVVPLFVKKSSFERELESRIHLA